MGISVINVTKRYGGIDILYNNIRKQTFKDVEVIIADELYADRQQEVKEYFKGIPLKHVPTRPKRPQDVWNLAKAYNDALKQVEGELVVSIDDFIWTPNNALQRFWEVYQQKGLCLITGVGNKAGYPEIVNPTGKITIFKQDYRSKPQGVIERDNRIDGRTNVEEVNHSFFELAYSAFPMDIARGIGGFDEETDQFYCGQDRNFALRCHLQGFPVYMDRGNENIGLFHQGFQPRPSDWEERHYNKNPRATMDIIEGKRPIIQKWL
jgi:glycosyltransferase involved in cell wall biosynthesis